MKIYWNRVAYDLQYIFLNKYVNQIPCWTIRKYIYSKCGIRLGKDARIGIGTVIIEPKKIIIGMRSVINENCYLDGRGKLFIGHDTSISSYTKILSASHRKNSKNFQYYEKKTEIGNYVWIGTGATVLDGSQIKNYTIIGAGAVIKGITEEGNVYIGNPAKFVKDGRIKNKYQLKYRAYFR